MSFRLPNATGGSRFVMLVVSLCTIGLVVAAPVPASAQTSGQVVSQPAAPTDDVEEQADGYMYRYSSDLELTDDGSIAQTVGIRFTGLDIPPGASIAGAYIEFVVDETNSEPTTLQFQAHDVANAPGFASSSFDITTRPLTTASVTWADIPAWTTVGATHQSPDLTPVIQEIVNKPGWDVGNAIAIIISGSGHRTAVAYDGRPADSPKLVVDYTTTKPIITNPGGQTNSEGDPVSLQIEASDPNGDPLTYSATGLPAGLSINPTAGLISGTIAEGSAGGYTVTVSVGDGTETSSTTFSWVVLGTGGPEVTFAVIGDYGIQNSNEADVANLVHSWNPDFVATLGDNSYSFNIDANIGQFYQQYIHPYTGSYGPGSPDVNRFFPALGNHDWDFAEHISCDGAGNCSGQYLDYFDLPGNERYYDVEWGPVHLFIVDSIYQYEPDGAGVDSVQAQWLQSALAASTAPWRLVLFHYPPYTSGNINGETESMRWPFEEWGATAVLAGHEHVYERLTIGNIPYFVNGLGGADKYSFGSPRPESEVRYAGDYGAMRVQAGSSNIVFEFINRSGEVIDTFAMVPSGPQPPAAPTITSAPADPTEDTDATFTFTSPTPGVTYQCTLDTTESTTCTSPTTYTNLSAGDHTFTVTALDPTTGLQSTPTTHTWTITTPPQPSNYADAVLADGPAGYWRLGDTGTTAADEVGAHPGSYENGVTVGVPGALSGDADTSVGFDGGNDQMTVADPDGAFDLGTSGYTIEAWVNTTVSADNVIVGKRSGRNRWMLAIGAGGQPHLNIREGRSQQDAFATTGVADGQWHHVVVAIDGEYGVTFHVDGQFAGFTALANPGDQSGMGDLQVGRMRQVDNYAGDLDELAIYRFALPATRIQAHYTAGSG